MKRFYDLACDSCGHVHEAWIDLDDVKNAECPECGKKTLRRKFSAFATGGSAKACDVAAGPKG